MKGYSLRTGRGNVRANEYDFIWTPSQRRPLSKFGVVLCHASANSQEYVNTTQPGAVKLAAYLAWAGIPCVAAEMSGQSWGNDASQTDIDNAVSYLSAQTGVPTTKVCLVGVSMGAYVATRYAIENPTKVAALVGCIPLTNMAWFYPNNEIGAGPEVAAAWGVTYPAALPSESDLHAVADDLQAPAKFYYSSDDPIVRPIDTTDFATLSGSEAINLGALGHSDYGVAAMVDRAGGGAKEIIDFFTANGA